MNEEERAAYEKAIQEARELREDCVRIRAHLEEARQQAAAARQKLVRYRLYVRGSIMMVLGAAWSGGAVKVFRLLKQKGRSSGSGESIGSCSPHQGGVP